MGSARFRRYKELADEKLQEGLDDSAFPVNIARVVSDLRSALPEDGILSLDNGLHKVVVARLFKASQPTTVLLDNGKYEQSDEALVAAWSKLKSLSNSLILIRTVCHLTLYLILWCAV